MGYIVFVALVLYWGTKSTWFIRGGDHVPIVVLEDKIMLYVITFIGGAMLGGIFGVFTMCMMIQAGQADDREEAWFDDEHRSN